MPSGEKLLLGFDTESTLRRVNRRNGDGNVDTIQVRCRTFR